MLESPQVTPDTILVTADDREPESMRDALNALPGVRVAVSRLKLGDYQVDDRLLVERKTLQDFALSVLDGRLFSQAARLAASDIPVALVEGPISPPAESEEKPCRGRSSAFPSSLVSRSCGR